MKCDFCDKKATVFLTQLVDGQMKKMCLCSQCAEERGVTDPTGFSLAEFLSKGFPPGTQMTVEGKPSVASPAGTKKCPSCGFTLEDLRRVRRFGCSDCYATFREEVSQMVRGMHKGAMHTGKVPKGLIAMQIRHQRLEELRTKLDQAVEEENYEAAATIRDEIRSLADAPVAS